MFDIGKTRRGAAIAIALMFSLTSVAAAVAPARAVETGSVYAAAPIGDARG